MKGLVQKIQHNFKAIPRKGFGIHSPFVFRFQREVLNPKRPQGQYAKESNKVLRMLLRMTAYFDLKNPLLLTNEYREGFENYQVDYSTLPVKSRGYDLVVLDALDFFDENYLSPNAFVVLTGKQENMQKNPLKRRCSVFLDLYSAGVCIFKKGLSQQEFKLKL